MSAVQVTATRVGIIAIVVAGSSRDFKVRASPLCSDCSCVHSNQQTFAAE